MLGLCFANVRAEHAKPMPNADAARRVKAWFMGCYAQRARLADVVGAGLRAIIGDVGPRVSSQVFAC